MRYNKLTADTTHSKMGSQYWEHDKYDDTEYSRYTQPTLRWVQSCPELPQEHTMHTRGRYSSITDGSTHAESNNKNIQCTLEADTAHSQMGPLMPRVTTRTYDAHSRQIQPLTDGSTHAESNEKNIQCTLEADTAAHSQMGPLMLRVTTRTYNAHQRQNGSIQ